MSDESLLNSQIADALRQIDASVAGAGRGFVTAAAYQSVAHTIALALQNAVAQQQHGYVLRNALTAAAANALLDGKREEADAILAMAESKVMSRSIADEVGELLTALRAVDDQLRKWREEPPPIAPEPEKPKAQEAAGAGD